MPLLAPEHGESSSSRSRSRQRARTEVSEHRSVWGRLSFNKFGGWLRRGDESPPCDARPHSPSASDQPTTHARPHSSAGEHAARPPNFLHRRTSRRVVPGLPRPLTFKRMQSEKRDRLLEVPNDVPPPRRPSATKARSLSPPPVSVPSMSAPDVLSPVECEPMPQASPLATPTIGGAPDSNIPAGARQVDAVLEDALLPPPPPPEHDEPPPLPLPLEFADPQPDRRSIRSVPSHHSADVDDRQLLEELEAKWILNLSMHFRDLSDREKFFITYAEEPTKWRRVTVSCDYRELEPESLEYDLKTLHYQRDKSARIYEAIRDSLPDIQFYDTVTNLKLQTTDGRLHVHVTEDVNEIIAYPPTSAIDHLDCKRFKESAVSFDSHISGFVYRVVANQRTFIKKEIPGPDAVEEFLYEINALCSLQDSASVIQFEGVIVDESNESIKGLLISYAEQGALVDMIYDYKPTGQLHWSRRERWAHQIVHGLSEIHEAGFVQGDFTLSNIVIDHSDNAKIIDINRRGCPVGWEPPELARLIESGQRISIYIGVKSDLFQLGMVLWALAEQQDEPERQERPISKTLDRHMPDVPEYFKDIVRACLSDSPRDRPSAKELLRRFPHPSTQRNAHPHVHAHHVVPSHGSSQHSFEHRVVADQDHVSHQHSHHTRHMSSFENIHAPSTDYPGSSSSYIKPHNDSTRGRSPPYSRDQSRNRRSDCSPYPGHRSVMSLDDSELENELASLPASRETRWEQIYVDGDTKLVQRACSVGDVNGHDFSRPDIRDICLGTPPGDMDKSFVASRAEDEMPMNQTKPADFQPLDAQSMRNSLQIPQDLDKLDKEVGSRKSFSDRVHDLAHDQTHHDNRSSFVRDTNGLADLEHDITFESDLTSSATTSAPLSRVGTTIDFVPPEFAHLTQANMVVLPVASGHRMPMHQDSGFGDMQIEHVSYESERIRHSLDERFDEQQLDSERVEERMWDEKDGTMFGDQDTRQDTVEQETLIHDLQPTSVFMPETMVTAPTPAVDSVSAPDSPAIPAFLAMEELIHDPTPEWSFEPLVPVQHRTIHSHHVPEREEVQSTDMDTDPLVATALSMQHLPHSACEPDNNFAQQSESPAFAQYGHSPEAVQELALSLPSASPLDSVASLPALNPKDLVQELTLPAELAQPPQVQDAWTRSSVLAPTTTTPITPASQSSVVNLHDDHSLASKLSDTTIRPTLSTTTSHPDFDFAFGVPKALQLDPVHPPSPEKVSTPVAIPIPTPTSVLVLEPNAPEGLRSTASTRKLGLDFLAPRKPSKKDDDGIDASDLNDYLSASIDFSSHEDEDVHAPLPSTHTEMGAARP